MLQRVLVYLPWKRSQHFQGLYYSRVSGCKLLWENWENGEPVWLRQDVKREETGEVFSDRPWESDMHILFPPELDESGTKAPNWTAGVWYPSYTRWKLELPRSFSAHVLISLGDAKGDNSVTIMLCACVWDYGSLMLLSVLMFVGSGRGSWLSVVFQEDIHLTRPSQWGKF